MDLEKLKSFIEFMDAHNLCELEIEEEGQRIKLKRAGADMPVMFSNPAPVVSKTAAEMVQDDSSAIQIKSPMVGTFYRAPSPGSKPYVDVGQKVKPGDVVCIVEAMKLMNEIKAEVSGVITDILVENGHPVEFGQGLFRIEAD